MMKVTIFRTLGGTLALAWTLAAVAASIGAQEPPAAGSVLDGVYTADQAKRGEAMYG
jgi:hypothetical protein